MNEPELVTLLNPKKSDDGYYIETGWATNNKNINNDTASNIAILITFLIATIVTLEDRFSIVYKARDMICRFSQLQTSLASHPEYRK